MKIGSDLPPGLQMGLSIAYWAALDKPQYQSLQQWIDRLKFWRDHRRLEIGTTMPSLPGTKIHERDITVDGIAHRGDDVMIGMEVAP